MLFHETFMRCPDCNTPYMVRDELVLLNKDARDEGLVREEEAVVRYKCKECERLIAEVKGEQTRFY